jgi:hypothetical protein
MAREVPRRKQVTVAELLVRSPGDDRAASPVRHREKPQVLRSLARLRVFSVVAGALALTGGVGAAVTMPVERSAGAVWPPAGLEPPAVALVPLPAHVVVPPAKPAPESATPSGSMGGVVPAAVAPKANSVISPAHRGKLAKAVKIIGKTKPLPLPKLVAPVRHEIPDVPLWSRGRPAGPSWQASFPVRWDAGHHHGCGGGGRHRR